LQPNVQNTNGLRTSQLYCVISILVALVAIITSSSTIATGRNNDETSSSSSSMITNGFAGDIKGQSPRISSPTSSESTATTTTPRHPNFMWHRVENIHLLGIELGKGSLQQLQQFPVVMSSSSSKSNNEASGSKTMVEKIRAWCAALFKIHYNLNVVDPSILQWHSGGWTQIVDKITRSSARLFAMANLVLAVTYLVHSAVADAFLGSSSTLSNANNNGGSAVHNRSIAREKLGGFLIFKLLLISAVVEPDTLDLLILLSWYTILAFLRSLSQLSSGTILHTSHSGVEPRNGVMQLLLLLFVADISAAISCMALFHSAGMSMVALLTCDCALLALEILVNLSQHMNHVLDYRHSEVLAELEQLEQREDQLNQENGVRLEEMEESHASKISLLDKIIFVLELSSCILTIFHFLHIWSLHGLTLGLVDGVLALHLHTAISSFLKKISHRRNLHKIARDLDQFFIDASSLEMKKAYAQGDVCCICLHSMVCSSSVKKLPCGHLYHTHCLREVVERARSVQAAKCPLCRASVLDGSHASPTSGGPQNEQPPPLVLPQAAAPGQQREHALFRFSTDNIVPSWLPLPAFSFEIVRRPAAFPVPDTTPFASAWTNSPENTPPATPTVAPIENNIPPNNNNANNMPNQSNWRRFLLGTGMLQLSPEEQAAALTQLVDMFPQYLRVDLLRELRERGTVESVVENILLGTFTGIARGMTDENEGINAIIRENNNTNLLVG